VDIPKKNGTVQASMNVTQDFYNSVTYLKTTRMVPITASGGVNDKVTYVLSQITVTYDGSELVSGMLNVTNMSFGITASPATRYPTPTQSPSLAPTAAKDYNSLTPSLVPTFMPLEKRAGVTLSPIAPSVEQQLGVAKMTLRLGIDVENFYTDVVNMLREDLAKKFKISPNRLVFKNLVAGSVLVDLYILEPQSSVEKANELGATATMNQMQSAMSSSALSDVRIAVYGTPATTGDALSAGSNVALIVGVLIGVIAAIAIAALVVVTLRRRKQRSPHRDGNELASVVHADAYPDGSIRDKRGDAVRSHGVC